MAKQQKKKVPPPTRHVDPPADAVIAPPENATLAHAPETAAEPAPAPDPTSLDVVGTTGGKATVETPARGLPRAWRKAIT
jgi:hypothetical protein